MQRLKFKNKSKKEKSKSRLRKAVLVFGLVGSTLLAGYWNWKCERPKPKPAPVTETIQRASGTSGEKARKAIAKLEKMLSMDEKKIEAEKKADAVLMKVVEEFPYEGLDCALLPREIIEFDYIVHKGSLTSCPDGLEEEIFQLGKKKNLDEAIAIARYFDSLNFAWDSVGFIHDWTADPENLAQVYWQLGVKAKENKWPMGPSWQCVARNGCAQEVLENTLLMIARMIQNDTKQAGSINQLPELYQEVIVEDITPRLFITEGFDRSAVERFFISLSHSQRKNFIENLFEWHLPTVIHDRDDTYCDVSPEEQISRAEELAKYASDPDLRSAMEKVAKKWKRMNNDDDEQDENSEEEKDSYD